MLIYSDILKPFEDKLIVGFTGKPDSYGGPALTSEQAWQHRRALCEELGLDCHKLRMPGQVHGANIRSCQDDNLTGTDALVVDETHTPVMLQFADCVPVILYDPLQHIGAVIHAGWRGTAQSIAVKTLEQLQNRYNVQPEDVLAVIGPSIGSCCFEVGPEVVEALFATVSKSSWSAFENGAGLHGNPRVNVKAVNHAQLQDAGVQQIEMMPHCTHCEIETLWSYRRGEAGRQVALLCLK